MGVEIGRNADGWEAAVNKIQLTEKVKEVFGVEKLSLHQIHRFVVYAYLNGVEELGYSSVCKRHPEFNEEIMAEIIETRHSTGIFEDETYKEHIGKVPKPHDGLIVGKAFLTFLLDE